MFQEYGNKLFVALNPSDSDNSELHDELIIIAITPKEPITCNIFVDFLLCSDK